MVAPHITGVTLDDGSLLPAQQMLAGAPSVLYDAVVVLVSDDGATTMASQPAAKGFVADAHAHKKIVGFVSAAKVMFEAAGLAPGLDDGYIDLGTKSAPAAFVTACRTLRHWTRP